MSINSTKHHGFTTFKDIYLMLSYAKMVIAPSFSPSTHRSRVDALHLGRVPGGELPVLAEHRSGVHDSWTLSSEPGGEPGGWQQQQTRADVRARQLGIDLAHLPLPGAVLLHRHTLRGGRGGSEYRGRRE